MKFTFDWNPYRDPAITVVGEGAGFLEEWAAAVAIDAADVDPKDGGVLIVISHFADDMAVYLSGLRLGFFKGFTQDLVDQQSAHEEAHSPQPILEQLHTRLGVLTELAAVKAELASLRAANLARDRDA